MATLQEYMARRNMTQRSSVYGAPSLGSQGKYWWIREREDEDVLTAARRAGLYGSSLKQEAAPAGSDAGFLEKTWETGVDVVGNILSGAAKSLEGVFDLGLGAVGAVGGIFDKSVRDEMRRLVEYDFTGENISKNFDRWSDDSELNNSKAGHITESVLSGVGQMLPTVAISLATGGAATPAMLALGASAAGNATEEAFNDGADYYRGLGYGVVSGGVEVATEKIFGGLGGLLGGGMLDNVTRSVAKTGAARVVKDMVGEAAEEALAEVVNPLARTIYKGRDALSDYGNADYWGGVGEAALVGGLTSVAYGATVGGALKTSGKYADVAAVKEEIEAIEKKRDNLETRGKFTAQAEAQASRAERENLTVLENILRRSNDKKRAELIRRYRLESTFESDGSIKESVIKRLDGAENSASSVFKREYYSPSLRGREDLIQSDLAAVGERAGTVVKVFDGELSEVAQKNYVKTKKALSALNRAGGNDVSLVITEASDKYKGGLVDDRTIYMSADQLGSGDYAATLVHEFTHFEEGTKEYSKMLDFLSSDEIVVDDGKGGRTILRERAEAAVEAKGYGVTKEGAQVLLDKVNAGEELTSEEAKTIRLYATEVAANETEILLGNESFIDRIVREDASTAQKLVDKILSLDKAFSTLKDKEAQAQHKLVREAERLYLKAAEAAGNGTLKKMILAQRPELEEELTGVKGEKMQAKVQHSLKIQYADGTVEELADARNLTNEQAVDYLKKAKKGELRGHTYIPVRKDTPEVIAETLKQVNENIDDFSLVMQVKKAQQAMAEEHPGNRTKKHGNNIRKHALAPEEIVDVVGKLDEPTAIIYQTNRHDKTGKSLPNNVAVLVEHDISGSEGVAVIEFDSALSSESIGKEHGDTNYHVVVTIFKPDTERNGVPFDYAEELLANPNNIELEIKRRQLARSATQEIHPNTSSKLPSANSIPHSTEKSTETAKKVSDADASVQLSLKDDANQQAAGDVDEVRELSLQDLYDMDVEDVDVPSVRVTVNDWNKAEEDATEKPEGDGVVYRYSDVKEELKEAYHAIEQSLPSGDFSVVKLGRDEKETVLRQWISKFNLANTQLLKERYALEMAKDIVSRVKIRVADQSTAINGIIGKDRLHVLKDQIYRQILSSFDTRGKMVKDSDIARREEAAKASARNSVERRAAEKTATLERTLGKRLEASQADARESRKITAEAQKATTAMRHDKEAAERKLETAKKRNEFLVERNDALREDARESRKMVIEEKIKRAESEKRKILYDDIKKTVENIHKFEQGQFKAASAYKSDIYKRVFGNLAKIDYRKIMNDNVRNVIAELGEWYQPGNPLFNGDLHFEQSIYDAIVEISQDVGELSVNETISLKNIIEHMWFIEKNFGMVKKGDKWVKAEPIAKKQIEGIKNARVNRTSVTNFILNRNFKTDTKGRGVAARYFMEYGEPMLLARTFDSFDEEGFYSGTMEEWRDAAKQMDVDKLNWLQPFKEFYDNHKGFEKKLAKQTVTYRGQDIPLDIATGLYMTLKTPKSQRAAVESYYTWLKENGDKSDAEGFSPRVTGAKGRLSDWELAQICKKEYQKLWELFDEETKDYIKMQESIYAKTRKIKQDTDIANKGHSWVRDEGYYYPTIKDETATDIKLKHFSVDKVGHQSIDKHVVQGSNAGLFIAPSSSVLRHHIGQLALDKNFFIPMENFNRLVNIDTGNNAKNPTTIQRALDQHEDTREMLKYMKELAVDIQGGKVEARRGSFEDLGRIALSHYAKFQLAANPKTMAMQTTALIAAGNVLDAGCIAKGMVRGFSKGFGDLVDRYCPTAAVRNSENTVAMAQGALEVTNKIGDSLMKGIGATDRMCIRILYAACQNQIAKDQKIPVGTEENNALAGKLLEKVIFETQQNSIPTERTAAMRSKNGFVRALVLFTSDAMKMAGRLLESIGRYSVVHKKWRSAEGNVKIGLEAELKKARKQLVKSVSSATTSAAVSALIALAFRALYAKDDEKEPEEIAAEVTLDTVGNLFGGFPILRDVYSFFAEGYDVDIYMISTINDLLNSVSSTADIAGDIIAGKEMTSQEVARSIRDMMYSAGLLLGVPVRNINNMVTGLSSRFSDQAKYWNKNLYSKQSYASDLQKAIEAEDEGMVSLIASMMIEDKVGNVDAKVSAGLRELVEKGYDVLPRVLGDSIVYDGEEIELTRRQRERFKAVYAIAQEQIGSMMQLRQYKEASEEVRAKAVKLIWNAYWDLAVDDVLGVDSSEKNVLFAEAIDMDKLALIVATAREIKADYTGEGKAISGTRLAKIEAYIESLRLKAAQKYMIMGYLGYKNKNGEDKVRAYIDGLSKLSRAEKEKLMELAGYNG